MSTSLYDLTIGSYTQILASAVGYLEKGKSHFQETGIDLQDVVETRLYENMADFHFQVISLNHHSTKTVAALSTGEFNPPIGYEPRDYDGLLQMTTDSLAELNSKSAEEINALADGNITFKMGSTEMPFTSRNFVLSFSLPNFYFHATTAYDILRMKGVKIGKMDFLGSMKIGS